MLMKNTTHRVGIRPYKSLYMDVGRRIEINQFNNTTSIP